MDACREAIYSNDYYDFINSATGRGNIYDASCIQPLEASFEVLYFPRNREEIDITSFTYLGVPNCYGLVDTAALERTGILTMQNFPTLSLKGNGILIGFVDTGINYLNPVFQREDGGTKIMRIWDQTIQEGPEPENFKYGAEFTADQINQAIRAEDPYSVVPSRDENGHGTFLAGVAAGSPDLPRDFIGAAPEADIAMVKLKGAKQYLRDYYFIREGADAYQENDIMAGIVYLNDLAYQLSKPLVICVGIGSSFGGHGGFTPLASLLDYVAVRRMRAVTVATGNEANARHHYLGSLIPQQEYEEVEISVSEGVPGFMAELWTNSPELVSVAIQSPTGELLPMVRARQGERVQYRFLLEGTAVTVEYSLAEYARSNELILMRFEAPVRGIWRIRVFPVNYVAGRYHIWLPLAEFQEGEVFFLRSNPETTLTEPSSASVPMAVGGYNVANNSLYLDSGRGFNIFDQVKPDFLAPAVDVYGPDLNGGYTTKTGTSIAAAIAAGASAQMMEWGVVRGNDSSLNTSKIKNYFLLGADREQGRGYPNPEEGYGRLNLYQAFLSMRRNS